MEEIRIFPASSRELQHERLLLAELIHRMNSSSDGVRFSLESWEYQDASMDSTRKQDSYDAILRTCDVCLAMFRKLVGEYTQEEVELALNESMAGRKPSRVLVLFDARITDTTEVGGYLADLKRRGVRVLGFTSDEEFVRVARVELRDAASVICGNCTDGKTHPDATLRPLKVGLATGPGLEIERLAFYEIAERLNRSLAADGIRIELDDSPSDILSCETAIAVYWKEIGAFDECCVENAYERLRQGITPRKFYVFFKDADKDVTPKLSKFKKSFETKYGHFVCRFEHVDSLKLQFAFQFAELCGKSNGQDITVTADGVFCRGVPVAGFDNLGFASRNEKHNRLRHEIQQMQAEVAKLAAESDDDGLVAARQRLHDLQEELVRHDKFLVDLARFFVREEAMAGDKRVQQARELFLAGEVEAANAMLDVRDILARDEESAIFAEAAKTSRVQTVNALLLKVKVSLAAGSLATKQGVEETIEAYENALRIQEEISGEDDAYADILHDYYLFLFDIREYKRLESVSVKAEAVFTALDAADHGVYGGLLGRMLNGHGYYLYSIGKPEEALPKFKAALQALSGRTDEVGRADAAMTRNNNGLALMEMGRFGEAVALFREALSMFEELESENPGEYLKQIIMLLNNAGECERRLGHLKEADSLLHSAVTRAPSLLQKDEFQAHYLLGMAHLNLGVLRLVALQDKASTRNALEELSLAVAEFSQAATVNPMEVAPNLALALNDRAVACHELGQREDEIASVEAALSEYRRLDVACPGVYADGLSMALFNLGIYYESVGDYVAAEKAYGECVQVLEGVQWQASANMSENMGKACGELASLCVRRGDTAGAEEWRRRLASVRGEVFDDVRKLAILSCGGRGEAARRLEKQFVAAGWKTVIWRPKTKRAQSEQELALALTEAGAAVVVAEDFARQSGQFRAMYLLGIARACVGDDLALFIPSVAGPRINGFTLPCDTLHVVRYKSLAELGKSQYSQLFACRA